MKQYVCIREGQINIYSEDEVVERIKKGEFFQNYFEVGREMELVIKLMPKTAEDKTVKKPVGKKKADTQD